MDIYNITKALCLQIMGQTSNFNGILKDIYLMCFGSYLLSDF